MPGSAQAEPWYDAFDGALEEVARASGDHACTAMLEELRMQRRRGVWPSLQTLADVPGRLEVERGDCARRVDRRVEAARSVAVDSTA